MVRWMLPCILLVGCTGMPDRTELFPGISEPRSLDEIDLRIEYVEDNATDGACRRLYQRRKLKGVPPPFFTMYMACVWTQADHEVPEGQRPICDVVLPQYAQPGTPLYEHEMAHCEGWDH